MDPKVSKKERTLHLSYDLGSRVFCSRIYPLSAPNGSTVIIYGHERGLKVLWRGGRRWRRRFERADDDPRSKDHEMMGGEGEDEYEAEEGRAQSDSSYPPVVREVNIATSAEVLKLAVPSFSSFASPEIPVLATTHMIVTVGCSDNRMLLLTIPLQPPRLGSDVAFIDEIDAPELAGDNSMIFDLAVKVIPVARNKSKGNKGSVDGRVLVAAVAARLNVWSLDLTPDLVQINERQALPMVHSHLSGSMLCFQSSPKSGQLLVADRSGTVRIYDTFAARTSQDPSPSPGNQRKVGRWIMSYQTPFQDSGANPMLARRKRILAASWVLAGRGILVLLEEGEWGIWDVTGATQPGKSCEDFALRGLLDASSAPDHIESGKHKKPSSKLAPMTPNTRKAKSENLFRGSSKAPGTASVGGISVLLTVDRSAKVDESIIIWHDSDIYSIPSMQSFWQRSMTSMTSGGGFGSLYAPGLTHVSDINLRKENITSISQFASNPANSGLGQMNIQKDLLVSAEHRLIISQSTHSQKPLFQDEIAKRAVSRDVQMLDAGELDLNGVDRMLDDMAGHERTRRVAFA